MFRPIKNKIEPYIGAGFGYYAPSDPDGSRGNGVGYYRLTSVNMDNCWGYNLLAGIDLLPGNLFHCMIELNYTIIKTDYSYTLKWSGYPEEITKYNDNIDLSFFATRLNFVIEF